MQELLTGFTPEEHLLAFVLGSVRLMVIAWVCPFLGNNVLTTSARTALVLALYAVLHPMVLTSLSGLLPLSSETTLLAVCLVGKEIFLGFLIGFLASMVFWTVQSAGQFIDNQRGASMAEQSDPLSGTSTSPTGSFLFQSVTFLFFASGAFAVFLTVVYSTYAFWPVQELLPAGFFSNKAAALFFGQCVSKLSVNLMLLAAPVVLACLFTDISLGLINRFASQLNVYILAMPIKSALSSFLLILYFAVLMRDANGRFSLIAADLSVLKGFFAP